MESALKVRYKLVSLHREVLLAVHDERAEQHGGLQPGLSNPVRKLHQ